jgi:hypothetical protein
MMNRCPQLFTASPPHNSRWLDLGQSPGARRPQNSEQADREWRKPID